METLFAFERRLLSNDLRQLAPLVIVSATSGATISKRLVAMASEAMSWPSPVPHNPNTTSTQQSTLDEDVDSKRPNPGFPPPPFRIGDQFFWMAAGESGPILLDLVPCFLRLLSAHVLESSISTPFWPLLDEFLAAPVGRSHTFFFKIQSLLLVLP